MGKQIQIYKKTFAKSVVPVTSPTMEENTAIIHNIYIFPFDLHENNLAENIGIRGAITTTTARKGVRNIAASIFEYIVLGFINYFQTTFSCYYPTSMFLI